METGKQNPNILQDIDGFQISKLCFRIKIGDIFFALDGYLAQFNQYNCGDGEENAVYLIKT
jgi:hypothetical protein